MSEETTDWRKCAHAALVAAQKEFEPVRMDKSNPHFKSRYASLAAVLRAVVPALQKYGLAVISRTEIQGDTIALLFELRFDGEVYASAAWAVGKTSSPPQPLGSALTYARRYTIQSLLGIAAEDDDDGNAAEEAKPAPF